MTLQIPPLPAGAQIQWVQTSKKPESTSETA